MNGETITLPDGRTIHPDQVLGAERPARAWHTWAMWRGRRTGEQSRDVDAVIIEATYLQEEAEMADQFAHLTAGQAAWRAVQAGVKHLILTHISRRYRERDAWL